MRIDASSQHLGTEQNPRPLMGIAWSIFGSSMYGLLFIFPNLWGEGLSPWQLTWTRFMGGLITLVPLAVFLWMRGHKAQVIPQTQVIPLHFARAALGVATFHLSIVAILHIDQANASAITMTSGVFTVALAMIFLRERPGPMVLLAGLVALIGGVIAAEPNLSAGEQFLSFGALAAFGAALFLGTQLTVLKFITGRDSTFVLVAAMSFFGVIITTPMALLNWQPMSGFQVLVFLSMGLLANVGQLGNVMAFRFASASFIAPIKYANIVITTLWAFLLLGQVPSLVFWAGAGLITLGGLMLTRARSKG